MMQNLFELVRYGAAGGIVTSAIANIAGSPSDSSNLLIAAVGAVLAVILVKKLHMVD